MSKLDLWYALAGVTGLVALALVVFLIAHVKRPAARMILTPEPSSLPEAPVEGLSSTPPA